MKKRNIDDFLISNVQKLIQCSHNMGLWKR